MAYTKAIGAAVIASLLLGVGVGAGDAFRVALGYLHPEDKATVYAVGIAEGANCAAFFLLVLLPLSVVLVFAVRRWRRRSARGEVG